MSQQAKILLRKLANGWLLEALEETCHLYEGLPKSDDPEIVDLGLVFDLFQRGYLAFDGKFYVLTERGRHR